MLLGRLGLLSLLGSQLVFGLAFASPVQAQAELNGRSRKELPKAERKAFKRHLRLAQGYMRYHMARRAVRELRAAEELAPSDAALNLWLGRSLYEAGRKAEAAVYYDLAFQLGRFEQTDLLPFARALHMDWQLERARQIYRLGLGQSSTSLPSELSLSAFEQDSKAYDACLRGLAVLKDAGRLRDAPPLGRARRLDTTLNSAYTDFGPLLMKTGNTLVFSSQRPEARGNVDGEGVYFEDIFLAPGYPHPDTILHPGLPLNSARHDAAVTLFPDGDRLLLFREANGGDFFVSRREGDSAWSAPKPLPGDVNSPALETSAFFVDATTLIFASARKGGVGGLDLYRAKRTDDTTWTVAGSLGNFVNSPRDEDAAVISPNGRWLIFASKGHGSMGGYDLFRAERLPDGQWGEPQNLRRPINSPGDDNYPHFTGPEDGLYASDRRGAIGDYDLFSFHLDLDAEPGAVAALPPDTTPSADPPPDTARTDTGRPRWQQPRPQYIISGGLNRGAGEETAIRGQCVDAETGSAVESRLVIRKAADSSLVARLITGVNGRFRSPVLAGRSYLIRASAPGYAPLRRTVTVPPDGLKKPLRLALSLSGRREAYVIGFKPLEQALTSGGSARLHEVVRQLKAHPDAACRLAAIHADRNEYALNAAGYRARLTKVQAMLRALGIASNRVSIHEGPAGQDANAQQAPPGGGVLIRLRFP